MSSKSGVCRNDVFRPLRRMGGGGDDFENYRRFARLKRIGPWSRAWALVPGPGTALWAQALSRVRKNQNPESLCVVKEVFGGDQYVRIDSSRQVIMTEPIFV